MYYFRLIMSNRGFMAKNKNEQRKLLHKGFSFCVTFESASFKIYTKYRAMHGIGVFQFRVRIFLAFF